jgi:hypothetical protein
VDKPESESWCSGDQLILSNASRNAFQSESDSPTLVKFSFIWSIAFNVTGLDSQME